MVIVILVIKAASVIASNHILSVSIIVVLFGERLQQKQQAEKLTLG